MGAPTLQGGSALAHLDIDAARTLWRKAGERFAKALTLNPDRHEAAFSWGAALDGEAIVLAPLDLHAARDLWRQAGECYAQALAIKPEYHEANNNRAAALVHESQAIKDSVPDEANALLAEAERILLQAEIGAPGSAAYNLACVAALSGKVDDCISWLTASRTAKKLPTAYQLREDVDLALVRDTPEFSAWWVETFGRDEPIR